MLCSFRTRLFKTLAIPLLALAAMAPAQSAPVSIAVSGFSFAPGSGYGVDVAESSGTLLDVLFSSAGFASMSFTLTATGASQTFDVGTVRLREANAHGGIRSAETDELGVQASVTFTTPFGGTAQLLASGSALAGSISDNDVDLTIVWSPIQLLLADGSLLGVTLSTLAFTGAQTLLQSATVTLLQAATASIPPTDSGNANGVPEPSTWLLASMALAMLALGRRRDER